MSSTKGYVGNVGKRIRERNEELILRAAEKVFSETGFKGATTSAIATLAGVPKANIHYYFPKKIDIYRRVIELVGEAWFEAAEFDNSDEPERALRKYISKKMDLAREQPLGSKLWAMEVLQGAPVLEEVISEKFNAWFDDRKSIVRRWIKEGKIKPVDPEALFYMIWATTQHYADFSDQIKMLQSGSEMSDRKFLRLKKSVCEIIISGVLP